MTRTITLKIAILVSVLLFTAPALADKHAQKRGTPKQAQGMVERAITFFNKEGAKAAFDRFTNRPAPEFRHLDLYIFVIRSDEKGAIVAHAADRTLVGKNSTTLIDANGLNIGRAILNGAKPKGAWVDYGWKDPLTGKIVPKSSWVVRQKGYIFGCGVHKL